MGICRMVITGQAEQPSITVYVQNKLSLKRPVIHILNLRRHTAKATDALTHIHVLVRFNRKCK